MSPRVFVRVSTFVLMSGLALQPSFGQGRGGTTSGGTSGTSGAGATAPTTGTAPSRTPAPSTTPPTQQQNPQQPIFLSGRVMMEDGAPPTESVVIERVCSGQPHAEGYTDSKGYFTIQLGARNGAVMQDASEDNNGLFGNSGSNPLGGGLAAGTSASGTSAPRGLSQEQRLLDCELRARLAGFRSQSISLANHRPMDPPDVGTILLHRLGGNEGTTVSMASLAAPKDARKSYERGMDALKKHKPADARKDFEKAVELYPKYALALCELGKMQSADGNMVDARKLFDAAVAADPKYVVSYLEIALLDLRAQSWKELAEVTEKAVKLDPFDYPQAHYYNAVANYYLKEFDTAEKSARQVEKLDTRHVFTKNSHLLGVILAQRQDYTGAVVQFKNYLKLDPAASDADTVRSQLSQLEKMIAEKKEQDHE
jgi:tetratricopeptide (TPR) repeat protein